MAARRQLRPALARRRCARSRRYAGGGNSKLGSRRNGSRAGRGRITAARIRALYGISTMCAPSSTSTCSIRTKPAPPIIGPISRRCAHERMIESNTGDQADQKADRLPTRRHCASAIWTIRRIQPLLSFGDVDASMGHFHVPRCRCVFTDVGAREGADMSPLIRGAWIEMDPADKGQRRNGGMSASS
jgi:hypothetical protein